MNKEKLYLYWLSRLPGIGPISLRKIRDKAGSFQNIYNMEEKQLKAILGNTGTAETILKGKKKLGEMGEEYHRLEERGIKFITPYDSQYPEKLRNIYDYPMTLYVRGALPLLEKKTVAVVGTRNCSSYGRQTAESFSKVLSDCGVQVISGLARGIDSWSHKGALSGKTATFAVLGSGIDCCYPRENLQLFMKIMENGGVISEYGPGVRPYPYQFPMRNRIISGLADGVLVVEAKEKSGSLITAELALEQGKEIFALPGRMIDELSAGCNKLIQWGGMCVTSPEQILEALGFQKGEMLREDEKNIKGLANIEKMVYSCLDLQPKSLEEVVAESGIPVGTCMSALFQLERAGYIRAVGHYYEKKLRV
ncbi:MAG: DNA-processing protein DprA [Lachnoclostridium edouardi]|uniref:DNA-processing protein DprA n=1 Tax=Lachnoclostridium edouardi TaxID=1926283 RepID=UPI0026DDA114|nr:DNA-processing protein DprA [Lachnoclostridium edouardi]MDO4279873.1 DNA-processing protein DprA [Lachnoclostridium edouardi]